MKHKVGGDMREKADWIKIRSEYINGNISYQKLAEKHGVNYNTLQDKARKEKWFAKKKAQQEKITEKTLQKSAEKLAEAEANRLLRISSAADKLLKKIEEATEQLDQFIVENKIKQREIQYVTDKSGFGKPKKEVIKEVTDKRIVKAGHLDRVGLKQLTSALKDLKDIQFTADEEKPQENPSINITVVAATPDDMVDDTEGEE